MSKLGSKLVPRLGPGARSILEAGRAGDDPTPADRARVKQALMRSIAASAASGATSAAGSAGAAQGGAAVAKGTSIGLGIKLFGGVVLALAVGAGVLFQRVSTPDPVTPKAAPIAVVPAPVDSANAAPKAVSAPDPVEVPGEPVPSEKAPVRAPSARSSAPVKLPAAEVIPVPEEDPLAAETRLLREAHGALQGGDPQKALTLLDEQGGQLGEERAAARVLALGQMGRVAEAEAARAAFLRDHPRSPLAVRIQSGCAPSPLT